GHVAAPLRRLVAVRLQVLAERDVLRRADLHRRERLAAKVGGARDVRARPDDEGGAAGAAPREHPQRTRAVPRVGVHHGGRTADAHVDGVADERLDDPRAGAEAPRLDAYAE